MIGALRTLSVLSLLTALVACGGGEESGGGSGGAALDPDGLAASNGDPVRGDWMVRALSADPENLNPLTSSDVGASKVLEPIFPPLITLDSETLELEPVIARELPEISDDHLSYVYRLRDDVTFSDGRPLTAHDVVFTVKATKNPRVRAPHLRNYYQSIRSCVAVDEHTVRFDMREPYFKNDFVLGLLQPMPRHHYDAEDLLAGISVEELDGFDAMPAAKQERATEFAKRFNSDFNRNPLGPGAYYIRDPEQDVRTGERVVLHRRDDYWAPGEPERGDGWVDRIVFRIVNDREAALVAFKSGEVDVVGLTPLQHVRQTSGKRFEERALKRVHVSPSYSYIGWNNERPILSDRRVRRALRHFVDKKSLIERVLFGLGVPVESHIFVERPEHHDGLPEHVFDPDLGKKLLAEAGWRDRDGDGVLDREEPDGSRLPLRLEIITASGSDTGKAVGLAVIDEMKRAGIDASFRQIDWTILLDRVKNGEFDAVIMGWGLNHTPPDPYQVWHSSQHQGSNHVRFSNAEVDRILEQYRLEFDPARRVELMRRFQEIVHEEQPYTFLFMSKAITAWDRRFHGVRWYEKTSDTNLLEWWVPVELQRYQD